MARKRDRAFAAFGAGLFLLTSSALTIAVIYSMVQQHNDSKNKQTASQTKQEKKPMDNTKLEGTQLEGFTPVQSVATLEKIDTVPGTGEEAKVTDKVTVDYTGAVAATGKIFQSSKDSGQPISFSLNQVIEGWKEGVPGMKVGGTRRLVIPANLAYGPSPPPSSGIPANAPLVFDITLHKIDK